MSTLVLALAAGLAVGNDPREPSAEVAQFLPLDVAWEGIFENAVGDRCKLRFDKGGLPVRDEGRGRLRMSHGGATRLGIYEYERGCLLICIREPGCGRPREFRAGDGQILFTLRRVEPAK